MIICPNFSNPEVAREFEELKNATSEAAAYHIWSLNNGNAIDKAPNGAESKLFLTLLEHYNGDRTKAIQAKAKVYGTSFLNWFGDWVNDEENSSKVVDENGEPLLVWHGGSRRIGETGEFIIPHETEELVDEYGELFPGNTYNLGAFFSSDKEYAEHFKWGSSDEYIYPVFLNIKTPAYTDKLSSGVAAKIYDDNWINILEGFPKFDGVIGHDAKTLDFVSTGTEYAVYNSNQIKSIDNQGPTPYEGTFSELGNIYKMSTNGQNKNPFEIPKRNAKYKILSNSASESFSKYLEKSRGVLPKQFFDLENGVLYVKSNTHSNSRKYDTINPKTGEVIAQGQVLLTSDQWEALQKAKEDLEKEFTHYSQKRSFVFKKGISTPSKWLFKKMAKLYLLEAIKAQSDIENVQINHEIIDEFVDQFDDSVWEHIVTYVLNPTHGFSRNEEPYGPDVFGLTTNNRNVLSSFAFNQTIPKQGLIDGVAAMLNKDPNNLVFTGYVKGEFYKNVKITRKLPYDVLKEMLTLLASGHLTEEERIKKVIEFYKIPEKLFLKDIERYKEADTVEARRYLDQVLYNSPAVNPVRRLQYEYNERYKQWLREKGITVPENIVHIIFSRDSFDGEDTPLIRLAAIMHEPYHALSILNGGSEVHKQVVDAFEKFVNTEYGSNVWDHYKQMNTKYSSNVLQEEFLADLFSIIMIPELFRKLYAASSSSVLGTTLAQDLFDILDRPDFKTIILAEPKTIIEELTEEQKIVLPLLKLIYNAIVLWLSKYSDFIKNTFKLYDEVQKVTVYKRIETFSTYEYKEKDQDLELFKEALDYLEERLLLFAKHEVDYGSPVPLAAYAMQSKLDVNSKQEVNTFKDYLKSLRKTLDC